MRKSLNKRDERKRFLVSKEQPGQRHGYERKQLVIKGL